MNELFFSDEKSSTTRPHDHVSYSINSISSPTISLPYVDVVNDRLIDLLCCGGCCCCCYCSDLQSILNHHMNTNRQHTNTHTQLNWMHFFCFYIYSSSVLFIIYLDNIRHRMTITCISHRWYNNDQFTGRVMRSRRTYKPSSRKRMVCCHIICNV